MQTMRVSQLGLILSVFSLSAYALPLMASRAAENVRLSDLSELYFHPSQRADLRCGIDSLYLLLQLLDKNPSIESLEARIPIDGRGSNLRDMVDSASEYDCQLVSISVPAGQHDRIQLPAIAQVEQTTGNSTSHFIVVLSYDATKVTYVDTALHEIISIPTSVFCRESTNVFLSTGTRLDRWAAPLLRICTGVFAAFFIVDFLWRRRKERSARSYKAMALFIPIVLMLVGCSKPVPVVHQAESLSANSQTDRGGLIYDYREIDLGPLNQNQVATATFTIRNATGRNCQLALSQPSCACSKVELKPRNLLAAGESAQVRLTIDSSAQKHGGLILAFVNVSIAGKPDTAVQLQTRGTVYGFMPQNPFCIRKSHIEANKIPDLELTFVAPADASTIQIRRIDCKKNGFPMPTVVTPIHIDIASAEAMTAMQAPITKAYYHRYKIPVVRNPEYKKGEYQLEMHFTIDEIDYIGSTNALLL